MADDARHPGWAAVQTHAELDSQDRRSERSVAMSEENDKDLERTQEFFEFLQGKLPDGVTVPKKEIPKLSADQAWTVIWYLGNQYWQVTDRVERCDVCGDLYHSWQGGYTLDFGQSPYSFCDSCMESEEFTKKEKSRLNPENAKPIK
jgi:hypothetical protein